MKRNAPKPVPPLSPQARQLLARAGECQQGGRLDEAEALCRQVLALHPDHPEATLRLGLYALQRGDGEQAVAHLESTLRRVPDQAVVHNYLGVAYKRLGRLSEAVPAYQKAVQLNPAMAAAHSDLGSVFQDLGQLPQALSAYQKAVELDGNLVQAHHNLATAYIETGNMAAAVASSERALALRGDVAELHHIHGVGLEKLGRFPEAIDAYGQSTRLNPDGVESWDALVHLLRRTGRWDELDAALPQLLAAAERNPDQCVSPQNALCLELPPAWHRVNAERCTAKKIRHLGPSPEGGFRFGQRRDGPLTIGYLSGDFRDHPVAMLIAELIEVHDRERVRVYCYSLGPDDGGALRARIRNGCDRFVDLIGQDFRQAARRIHKDGVDILVDLSGFTEFGDMRITAQRPAPVQVSYLGFSGTTGADFLDYVVADPFVAPPELQPHFSECLVHLPDSYMAVDTTRPVAEPATTRAEAGLPEDGFVFCAFNDAYKITRQSFDVWMSVLAARPGSVLWVRESNPFIGERLREAAAAGGVDPARLVFAPRVASHAEHLSRHRLADLYLDTLPSYAHTSAADALWAGLPILTCPGDTFSHRVTGSLLTAMGLPELIAESADAYREQALRLASDPAAMAALSARTRAARDHGLLFDTRRFAAHLEHAYGLMWERHTSGLPPVPITVPPLFLGEGRDASV